MQVKPISNAPVAMRSLARRAGQLHTCLFSTTGYDVRQRLRSSEPDESTRALRALWQQRSDRYSEQRADNMASRRTPTTSKATRVEMSYIGG